MKITAVICEYNPFTNGHLKHLRLAREETGADTVICIMSGSFTQRGDAAILGKYRRAETAVRLGADMVIELPLIYAVSPADNFAYGALKTLTAVPDLEYLSFGSECGNADLIKKAADFLSDEPEGYKAVLKEYQDQGNSFPKSRSLALIDYAKNNPDYSDIADILEKPNNVLGISYLQAAKKLMPQIKIHTVKRESDYNDLDLDNDYPSASAIRTALARGEMEKVKPNVPAFSYNQLEKVASSGSALGDMCLFKLKDMSGYDLEKCYDVNNGLHNRLKLAASTSATYEKFLENAKTKKYTMARIKRISIYALFDITKEMYDEISALPPYLHILAMNKERKDLLRALHANYDNVLNRYSDIEKADKRLRPYIKLDFRAQGALNIINRSEEYERAMLLV